MHQERFAQLPIGIWLTVGGGITAQVTAPTTNVGSAGLIVSITGLVVAVFQYYKAWLDSKSRKEEIDQLKANLETTRNDLATSRLRRHEEANRLNGVLLKARDELMDARLEIAALKGKLGLSEQSQIAAINDNADNILAVARHTAATLPKPVPHVGPMLSDDEASGTNPNP